MKTLMLLTALFAALIFTGCSSTYRGGTIDDYDTQYQMGTSPEWPNRSSTSPVRDFTQPLPPP